jgi:hypothetical protein
MSIKSTSISSARQQSVQSKSAGFIFVANAYAATGAAIGPSTDIKRYVVVPGQTETIQAIAGGDAPTISSIVVTDENWVPTGLNVIDNLTGGYIEINGTGFDAGTAVYLNGQSITTIFVNSTLLRVEVPPSAIGTYSLMIFTSTGAGVIYLNLDFSSTPAFITPAGSIGSFYELLPFSVNVVANADSVITYSVQSGSLPANVTLAANGVISGNAPAVTDSTVFSIVILANDEENQQSTRSFNFTILSDLITWYSPSGNVTYVFPTGYDLTETSGNITLNAQAISNAAVSYSANTLPTGITLNGNLISGTPAVQGNVYSLITATTDLTNKSNSIVATFKIRDTFDVNNYVSYFANSFGLGGTFDVGNHFISPDGTNYYVADYTNEKILQYRMEANTLTTLTYQAELAITANGTAVSNPYGIAFKDDGTKLFVAADPNTPWINEYVLTTPWNINSAVFVSNLSASPASTVSIDGLCFANAGQRLYTLYSSGLSEWELTTNWQVNTATYTGRRITLPSGTYNATVTEDGTVLWSANASTIQKRSLTVPYRVNASTLLQSVNSLPANTPLLTSTIAGLRYMQITNDGKRLFFVSDPLINPIVLDYELSTPSDLKSIQYKQLGGFYVYEAYGLRVKDDGQKFCALQFQNVVLSEFELASNFDIGTANFVSNLSTGLSNPSGVAFKTDGTKVYINNATRINEYVLTTPWQTNNAVLIGNLTVVTNQTDIAFSSNGDRMYGINSSSDNIIEYHLTVPWQINTATQRATYSISSYEAGPQALFFNTFGNIVLFTGTSTDSIHQLNLSTPWQINTASYVGNVFIGTYAVNPQSLCLNSIGTNLYFSGSSDDMIWQWKLG